MNIDNIDKLLYQHSLYKLRHALQKYESYKKIFSNNPGEFARGYMTALKEGISELYIYLRAYMPKDNADLDNYTDEALNEYFNNEALKLK